MQERFDNYLPRRIRFGRGVSAELPAVLRSLGVHKPCVVPDVGVAAAGLLAGMTTSLAAAGISFAVFDRTDSEPPFACVDAAVDAARSAGGVDGVVALGGGSVMDTAKLVAATHAQGIRCLEVRLHRCVRG